MYAPDGRIPLHPTIISEGVGSLLPDELRSAFVWEFELDAAANVTQVHVERARVRSRRQCRYVEVQAELDGAAQGRGEAPEWLELLQEVGLKRIALERVRGGASLNRPDEEVRLEDGRYVLTRRESLPVEGWNAQLSLMTGMAAATFMLDGKVGILRTMPAPDEETIARFRRQVDALGVPWSPDLQYGEYLRTLDPTKAQHLAVIHAAASLFRGAGYTAFDGDLPDDTTQAAVAAPYAHATAPLRRLVDRFVLVTCEALCLGRDVPKWVREALPELPHLMASSDGKANQLEAQSLERDRGGAAELAGRRRVRRGRRADEGGRRRHPAHRPGGDRVHGGVCAARASGARHLGDGGHRDRARCCSGAREVLREHHEDPARPTHVRELDHVLVVRDAPQREEAVPGRDLEGLVDVVHRERDTVHPDLVGQRRFGLDRVGMDVFEQFELTLPIGRREHRDLRVVAVEADGGIGPIAADLVTADDREAEIGEEGDGCFEVAHRDGDVLQFDGHGSHATERH